MTSLNCRAAIAYVKVEEHGGGEATMELSHDDSPVLRRLGDGILVAYVVDVGDAFQYVMHRHLRDAGMTEEQLHTDGLANLGAVVRETVEVRPYGNIFAVVAGGNFEASLILVDDFWTNECKPLCPNGIVAALPARDILAFGDANSPDAIDELRALCERVGAAADHALTSTLFRRIGTSWTPHVKVSDACSMQ